MIPKCFTKPLLTGSPNKWSIMMNVRTSWRMITCMRLIEFWRLKGPGSSSWISIGWSDSILMPIIRRIWRTFCIRRIPSILLYKSSVSSMLRRPSIRSIRLFWPGSTQKEISLLFCCAHLTSRRWMVSLSMVIQMRTFIESRDNITSPLPHCASTPWSKLTMKNFPKTKSSLSSQKNSSPKL